MFVFTLLGFEGGFRARLLCAVMIVLRARFAKVVNFTSLSIAANLPPS